MPMAEINVTPLVDVVLVLLIIFMVTAPFLQGGLEIDLPKVATHGLDVHEGLVVSVRADRTIAIGNRIVTTAQFESALQQAGAPQPKPEPVAVTPTDESGVKLQPPKPKVKPKTEPKVEQTPPPAATPALPYAAVGPAGLQGAISLDSNFEFTYYLTLVRNRIAQ